MDKVPSVPKVRREFKNLRDIRGPSTEATEFTQGQYGILVSGRGGEIQIGVTFGVIQPEQGKQNPRS